MTTFDTPMTASDIVSLVGMSAVAAWHAILLLFMLIRSAREGQMPTLPNSGCNCWNPCRMCGCGPWKSRKQRDPEPVDAELCRVEARLTEIRIDSYLEILNVWLHLCGVYAAMYLYRYMMAMPRVNDGVQTSLFAASYITTFVFRVYPTWLNKNTLLIIHMWCMGLIFCFGLYVAVWNSHLFVHYSTQMHLLRVTLCIAYPYCWLNVCWNVVWVVPTSIGYFYSQSAVVGVPMNNVVFNEIFVALFLSYVLWKFELLQVSQVRSDHHANAYLRAKKTMERLLADMCDAVVELDQNLGIRHASTKLANLLLRHTGNNALKGEQFANLSFGEEDSARFHDFVGQRAIPIEDRHDFNDDTRPSSAYMNLRDSTGTPVCVQIFHSCHQGPLDEVIHIVGVREMERSSQEGGAPDTVGFHQINVDTSASLVRGAVGEFGRQTGGGTDVLVEARRRARADDDADTAIAVASNDSGSWASDLGTFRVPLIPEEYRSAPITVLFDPLTDVIVASTVEFQSFTGPLMCNATMKDLVVNYEDFRVWTLTEVNGFFLAAEPKKFQFKVAPSFARQPASFEFYADAFILSVHQGAKASSWGVQPSEDADEEEFEYLCVLVLGQLAQKWRRKKRRPHRLVRRIEAQPAPQLYGVEQPAPQVIGVEQRAPPVYGVEQPAPQVIGVEL